MENCHLPVNGGNQYEFGIDDERDEIRDSKGIYRLKLNED